MKKIIASFTVIVYFIFACGVMVNYHFCMDQYHSFSLYQAANDKCATCGMHAKKHGCCHNEVKIVKLQNAYQTSSASFSINTFPSIAFTSPFLFADLFKEEIFSNTSDHSPPLLARQDVYLQNCVFRI